MLRVDYTKTYGYFYIKSNNFNKKEYLKCHIHPANCLFAVIYHDKKRKTSELIYYFSDLKHLTNCLGLTKPTYSKEEKSCIWGKDDFKKIVLFDNMPHFDKIASAFVKAGYKVELRHKEEKKKR